MNLLKNERGSTLAMTLMILVLFTVLGFGLITLNTSASKQFNNTEQKVQARHFAEMGLLHYKSEAYIAINAHNQIINGIKVDNLLTEEKKIEKINQENSKICSKLTKSTIIDTINNSDSNYNISIPYCRPNAANSLVDIIVNSIGESPQGKVVSIDLDLSVTSPGTLKYNNGNGTGNEGGGNSNTAPSLPTPPSSGKKEKWDPCDKKGCITTFDNFTDVSATPIVKSKKGNMIFNDSLVMNNFRVDGGNGLQMTVKKDLYIKGILDVQNHACIMVQGNFTAKTKITSKNKFYLFVYGDANLPKDLTLTSSNNDIFISGDVYIDGKKQVPKPAQYSSVPNEFSGCSLPGAPTPTTPEITPEKPTTNSPLNGNLDAVLITNEYRYL